MARRRCDAAAEEATSKPADAVLQAKLLDRFDSKAALAEATKHSRIELPELPVEKRWKHRPGWVANAEATDGTYSGFSDATEVHPLDGARCSFSPICFLYFF